MTDALDHVRRRPLPWRADEGLTECGLPADSYQTITHDELDTKAKKLGQQRTAMTSCMTCLSRAQVYGRRAGSGGRVELLEDLEREIQRVRYREGSQLVVELEAIVALIADHRDEFDQYIADRGDTVDLTAERTKRTAQARYERGTR